MPTDKTNVTLSLSYETQDKLHALSRVRHKTMSAIVEQWVDDAFHRQDRFIIGRELKNPIIEMLDVLSVKQMFVDAVEAGLVMTFEEYARRYGRTWGSAGSRHDGVEPFVYIDEDKGEYEGDRFEKGDIVCNSRVDMAHHDIISVWCQHNFYGRPRLRVDYDSNPHTIWMGLEFVVPDYQEMDDEVWIAQADIDKETGKVTWLTV